MQHILYTNADPERPDVICDGAGAVTLSLCKVCGQGEGDLQDTCPGPKPKPDKTCVIQIHNVLGWDLDEDMTREALAVAARHVAGAKAIDIYPQLRAPADAPSWKKPGWLEWSVRVHYRSGGTLHIAVIQRKPDAEFETHS